MTSTLIVSLLSTLRGLRGCESAPGGSPTQWVNRGARPRGPDHGREGSTPRGRWSVFVPSPVVIRVVGLCPRWGVSPQKGSSLVFCGMATMGTSSHSRMVTSEGL